MYRWISERDIFINNSEYLELIRCELRELVRLKTNETVVTQHAVYFLDSAGHMAVIRSSNITAAVQNTRELKGTLVLNHYMLAHIVPVYKISVLE